MAQPFFQFGIALADRDIADGIAQSTLLADEDADFLCPGYSCIDEITLEHDITLEEYGHDDDRVLAALRLVDVGGIG